jgi:hypothetical protein
MSGSSVAVLVSNGSVLTAHLLTIRSRAVLWMIQCGRRPVSVTLWACGDVACPSISCAGEVSDCLPPVFCLSGLGYKLTTLVALLGA